MKEQKIKRRIKRNKQLSIKKYKTEYTILFLFLAGIFLLKEDLEIKAILKVKLLSLYRIIHDVIIKLIYYFRTLIYKMEISDIIGFILIIIAFIMFMSRIKQNLINKNLYLYECRDCGSSLKRIHSEPLHKILSFVFRFKVKHYQCSKCNFSGIKISRLKK